MREPNPALQAIDDIDPSIFDQLDKPATQRVEFPDVLVRFTALLAVVLAAGVVGWVFLAPLIAGVSFVVFIVMLGLIVVAAATARTLANGNTGVGIPLAFTYAAVMGAVLGAISQIFDAAFGDGIIQQAILATTITTAVVVAFSATPVGKRSGRAVRFFVPIAIGYLIFLVANFVAASFFGVGDGWGFGGAGWLGILISLFGVALASWSVNIDVVAVMDNLGRETHKGVPWALAFGLIVSILWLYIEVLRLLARSRS